MTLRKTGKLECEPETGRGNIRWQKRMSFRERKEKGHELEVRRRVVRDKKRKIFFSERSQYIIKRMHFRHLQWSLQLYLKFARQCMKCYCCCSPPGNRPYSMWCWYQFSVSSVVWKTTAMKIIAGPLTSEFVHLSGIIVKLVLLPLTWRWMQSYHNTSWSCVNNHSQCTMTTFKLCENGHIHG